MPWLIKRFIIMLLAWSLPAISAATSAPLKIAVASNFANTAAELAPLFEAKHAVNLQLSVGSTSKHSIQIQHGAPYDVFLAADRDHPQRLIKQQLAQADSLTTYAIGQLALWAPRQSLDQPLDAPTLKALLTSNDGYIAIANPKLAPYGLAAKQMLQKLGLWASIQPRLLRGENVGQSYQYTAAGGAEFGLVAASQLLKHPTTQIQPIPPALYPTIEQQAVIIRPSHNARLFMQFLRSPAATLVIRQHGYLTTP